MIMTVDELRKFVETDEKDQVLEARLQAIELLIRAYTNNNFQVRSFRAVAVSSSADNSFTISGNQRFSVGDTLEITESDFMPNQLVTVAEVSGNTVKVKENLCDESGVVITKVKYPADVKMGAANLMKWELERREKVGVSSETISRHSVTFYDMSEGNSSMGFPKSLMGFLAPYKRARFGRGIRS